jgi:hypothetical protein
VAKRLFAGILLVISAGVLGGCGATDTVAAGDGSLQLTLSVPEGYHLNGNTISRVVWEVDGIVVETEAELETQVVTLDDPVTLPVTFSEGEAVAIARLEIRYCTDDERRCLFEEQDLQLPVQVSAKGSRSVLAAEYAIVPPEE